MNLLFVIRHTNFRFIISYLENLETEKIVDHGVLRSNEWFIKFCADKGQGMTSLSFNVVNQISPNSSLKHIMLFIYEGGDNHYNINAVFEVIQCLYITVWTRIEAYFSNF